MISYTDFLQEASKLGGVYGDSKQVDFVTNDKSHIAPQIAKNVNGFERLALIDVGNSIFGVIRVASNQLDSSKHLQSVQNVYKLFQFLEDDLGIHDIFVNFQQSRYEFEFKKNGTAHLRIIKGLLSGNGFIEFSDSELGSTLV